MARRSRRLYDQAEEESIYGSDSIYAAPEDDEEYEDESIEEEDDESYEEQKKRKFGRFFSRKNSEEAEDEIEEEKTLVDIEDDDEEEDDDDEYEYEDEKGGFPFKIVSIVAALVIAIGAGAYFVFRGLSGGSAGEAYVQSVAVITGSGSSSGMANRYTGEVEPQSSWKIDLNTDSTVAKCYVQVGSEVKKGDKLFKYDTEALQLNLEKQQLDIDTIENEQKELAKNIETYEKEAKTADATGKIEYQTEILTAQATIKKNEYNLKSAKEQLKKSKKTIQQATVKSKMDGVVKSINTKLGEGGTNTDNNDNASSNGDNSYMTILATGDFRVKGMINETNIHEIVEGDPVIVRSRVNDDVWHGVISKIKTDSTADDENQSNNDEFSYGAENGASTSQYNFYVTLTSDEGLLMGQHVFIERDIGQDDEQSGIWLPSYYLTQEDGHFYVWKDKKGKLKKVEVKVDADNYNELMESYPVLSGISVNDYIAVADDSYREDQKTTKTKPVEETEDDIQNDESNNNSTDGDAGEDLVEGEPIDEGEAIDGGAISDEGF